MQILTEYAGLSPRAGIIKLIDEYNKIVNAIIQYMDDCPTITWNGEQVETEVILNEAAFTRFYPLEPVEYPVIGTKITYNSLAWPPFPDFFLEMESRINTLFALFAKEGREEWTKYDIDDAPPIPWLDYDETLEELGIDHILWRQGLNINLFPARWIDNNIKLLSKLRYLVIGTNEYSFTFSQDKDYTGSIANSWIERRGEQVGDEWVDYYDFWQQYAYTTGDYEADYPLGNHLSDPFYDEYRYDEIRDQYGNAYDKLYEIVWGQVSSNFEQAIKDNVVGDLKINLTECIINGRNSTEVTTYETDRYVGGVKNTRRELTYQYVTTYNNTRKDVTFEIEGEKYETWHYSWSAFPEESGSHTEAHKGDFSVPCFDWKRISIIGDNYKTETGGKEGSGTGWTYTGEYHMGENDFEAQRYYTFDISVLFEEGD